MKKPPMIPATRFAYVVGGALVLAVGIVCSSRIDNGLWQFFASVGVGVAAGVLFIKGTT